MGFDPAEFYDAELRRHDAHFRAAMQVGMRDRVLDIGCGAGQSTRQAARAAVEGQVLGVDLSEALLGAARRRSAQEGLGNVAFELGDAQVYGFAAGQFDLCVSRFGTMFFSDPAAAFANIGRALRPGGRLVMMVWQGRERNEWATAIPRALGQEGAGAAPAFSLADQAVTAGILTRAGFGSVAFDEVHEPVFYGADVDLAQAAVVRLFLGKDAATGEVLQRLHLPLAAHLTADGVLFDSHAWIVSAQMT